MKALIDLFENYAKETLKFKMLSDQLSSNHRYLELVSMASEDENNSYLKKSVEYLNIISVENAEINGSAFFKKMTSHIKKLKKIAMYLDPFLLSRDEIALTVEKKLVDQYAELLQKNKINKQLEKNLRQESLVQVVSGIDQIGFDLRKNLANIHEKEAWKDHSILEIDLLIQFVNQKSAKLIEFDEFLVQELTGIEVLLQAQRQWDVSYEKIDFAANVKPILKKYIAEHGLQESHYESFDAVKNFIERTSYASTLTEHCFYDHELQAIFEQYNKCSKLKLELTALTAKSRVAISSENVFKYLYHFLLEDSSFIKGCALSVQPLLKSYHAVCISAFNGVNTASLFVERGQLKLKKLLKLCEHAKDSLCQILNMKRMAASQIEELDFLLAGGKLKMRMSLFKYIREYCLFTGDTGKCFRALKLHAKNHPQKKQRIEFLLEALQHAGSAVDLQSAILDALQDKQLMQCNSHVGKQLNLQSTTGVLLLDFEQAMDNFIKHKIESNELLKSMKEVFSDKADQYFYNKSQTSFEYALFVRDKMLPFLNYPEVATLVEELFLITSTLGETQEHKKVRMIVSVHTTLNHFMSHDKKYNIAVVHLCGELIACEHQKEISRDLGINQLAGVMSEIYHRYDYAFIHHYQRLRLMLKFCKTNRNKQLILKEMDALRSDSTKTVPQKVNQMIDSLSEHYRHIRSSHCGSNSIFGNGSRLGDDLEAFLLDGRTALLKRGSLPHKMKMQSVLFKCIPSLAHSEDA